MLDREIFTKSQRRVGVFLHGLSSAKCVFGVSENSIFFQDVIYLLVREDWLKICFAC